MSGGWEGGWINIIANSAEAEARANGFEVYSLSFVTFVYYRELNSSYFILVRWVGGWVKLRLQPTQPKLKLELGLSLAKRKFTLAFRC